MTSADEDRIRRASRGDAAAMEELLATHLPGLEKYVRRHASPLVLAKESVSDLVQSVCREVLQDAGSFDYRGDLAFRAWLHQAALRKLMDRQRYYRAAKRDPACEREPAPRSGLSREELAALASSIDAPSGAAEYRDDLQRLDDALGELSEADRELVRLVFCEGLTHAQVAERLSITEVSSRKQLSRALARLSRRLA